MPSLRSRAVAAFLRRYLRPRLNSGASPESQRRAVNFVAKLQRMPAGVDERDEMLGGVPALVLEPTDVSGDRALLFVHGGGFVVGSPRSHRAMGAYLAKAAGCRVYLIDYRLAPEHPYPAAADDTAAAFAALCERTEPDRIALCGDSAGAQLALSLAQRLRDEERPLPAILGLFCPFADMTLSGDSIVRNRHHEPLLTKDWLDGSVKAYAAEMDRNLPELSPIQGRFEGLPPMFIQAAGHDILLDDARRIHAAANAAGVSTKLEVYAEFGHDFQLSPDLVPEARRALAIAGAYLKIRH